MRFRTYRVGRSVGSDVQLDDPGVSRRQIELTLTAHGKFFIVDCNSSCGTFIWREEVWIPFKQGYVEPHEKLRFGSFALKLSNLLERLPDRGSTPEHGQGEPLSVRPRRKVSTGEIELIGARQQP